MSEPRPLVELGPGDPRKLGRWELLGRLGAGGMGVVYLGRDGERLAAVKTVATHLAQAPEFRARFRREVAVCALVEGPQVAQLYEADADADIPWLAVQYVPGPTLDQVVRESGPLNVEALDAFAIASLEALRQIHAKGVTHRDLKPANVILTARTPILIDFGIARVVDGTAITATQTMIGSSGWMAPEVLTGGDAGPAADLFSWGALVTYAGTGRPPFGAGPAEAVAYRVVHGEPDLSELLVPVLGAVRGALARRPADRPNIESLTALLTGRDDPNEAANTIGETISVSWRAATQALSLRDPLTPGTRAVPASVAESPRGRRGLWLAAAGVAVVASIALAATLDPELINPAATPTSPTTRPVAQTPQQSPGVNTTPAAEQSPDVRRLAMTIDGPEDLAGLLKFAQDHVQDLVVLDITLVGSRPEDIAVSNHEIDLVYDASFKAKCELCGLTLALKDMGEAPDAQASQTGSIAVLTGRFVVQAADIGTGGFVQIGLRAVPAGSDGSTPTDAAKTTCHDHDVALGTYPGTPLSTTNEDNPRAVVRSVQDILNLLGYGCLDEDGLYGPMTRKAVLAYQKDRAAGPVNGAVDEGTWNLLQEDLLFVSGDGDCGDDC